ncbi:hypothetical protein AB0I35_27160 [Nocardia sp. NPDC050378]|uniref:hypothetical protein n=1 Tax=Nocardia sp. NPDC050378 TaxID=3155400 RepID=UPI0033E659D2
MVPDEVADAGTYVQQVAESLINAAMAELLGVASKSVVGQDISSAVDIQSLDLPDM